jgi:hypothetical protein
MKKPLNEEFRRMQRLAGLITESQLDEAAGEDLELKSAAKQIFSVLKKYGLKPEYEVDGKQFTSKDPHQSGYGARVHINNGIMTVAVYDRGIWQTIQRKQKTNELDMGNVSYPTEEEKQQINQIAGKIYNDIVSTLGKDKFELRSQPKPNEYGDYIIQIRKKQTNPKPQAESLDIDTVVNEALRKFRKTENQINEEESLSSEEQKILDDILDGADTITEGMFDSIIEKVKKYAKRGLITVGILSALLSTPGISSAQQTQIKDIAKTEMSSQQSTKSDVSKMDNAAIYNLVIKLVKTDPDRALALLQQMKSSGQEEANDLNMLKTFVQSIKDGKTIQGSDYIGKRLKMAGKFTQELVNNLQTKVYRGGF